MSNPPPKRQRLSEEKESSVGSANDDDSGSGMSEDVSGDEEEILNLKPTKSQQTKKRKIRATGTSNFGATLQSLLSTEAPTDLPLSLKPSLARRRNDEKLESKAKKVLQLERKEKEDKNRITDVIGGWGGESERALRKVAQRGGAFYSSHIRAPSNHVLSGKTIQRCPTITNRSSKYRGREKGRERQWETAPCRAYN